MSDPSLAILLVLGIISVILLTWILILSIPLKISLSFRSHGGERKGIVAVSWLVFGLEVQVSGKDSRVSVNVGRTRLITRPLSLSATPPEKPRIVPDPGRVPDIISALPALQGPVLSAILDLMHHTRFDYARVTARIGLSDPSATGMVYGMYRAVLPLLPANRFNLTVIPEFKGEVYEIDMTTRFHVMYPFRILVNAVKVVKHPAARKVMKTMREKPRDVAA
jgi:hypothetical protein